VDDKEGSEDESGLPRVKAGNISTAVHPQTRPQEGRCYSPHIITLVLENQQHHSARRRQHQIRQTRLDLHPETQTRCKHICSWRSSQKRPLLALAFEVGVFVVVVLIRRRKTCCAPGVGGVGYTGLRFGEVCVWRGCAGSRWR